MIRRVFPIALLCLAAHAQQPDAAAIMAQVAANQDRSEHDRTHVLYVQHARIIDRKGSIVQCEETSDIRVIPAETGAQQVLLKLDGRRRLNGGYEGYTELPAHAHAPNGNGTTHEDEGINVSIGGGSDTDRELVESLRNNLIEGRTRDGIGAGLFPLTSRAQSTYNFRFVKLETMNDRIVFHLTFEPKDRSEFDWKGDAYIDTTAFQPVLVRTTQSRRIPFAVRTLLGTSLPGLGFTVTYAPRNSGADGETWFPTSFGTEFKLKLFFFFHREIVIAVQNHDFERTHVNSRIVETAPPASP